MSKDCQHCTHAAHEQSTHSAHAHHGGGSLLRSSALVTGHCLLGCTIGEFIGLSLGLYFGWSTPLTITVAVILAFISGFSLSVFPLMRREQLSFVRAMQAIWFGEVISISVMEFVENFTDYHMGGLGATSFTQPVFWTSMLAAIVAGYLAAWPINYFMLRRQIKRCC